jgi:hypothetical protein
MLEDMINYDQSDKPLVFFSKVSFGVIGGLVLGALIDTVCNKLQNDNSVEWRQRSIYKSILFFIIQIVLNIMILLFLCLVFPEQFIKWFQLTISGALFAVLLFAVQRNLIDNSLRITLF